MSTYQRMTLELRCQIYALLQAGFNQKQIADKLGFHKSSISRELKRLSGSYCPLKANKQHIKFRKLQCPKSKVKLYWKKIHFELSEGLSPEQLVGRSKLMNEPICSYQTIYNHAKNNRKGELYKLLRRYNKRGYSRYSRTKTSAKDKNNISIAERPQLINRRGRFGDWERDCFFMANRNQILVFTERLTRYTEMIFIGIANGKKVASATKKVFKRLGHTPKSMTQDNGTEFRKLPDETFIRYRCAPYRPDQRGTVENTIGLIRQYIKRKDLWEEIGTSGLKEIQDRINNRPRKILGFKTPAEMFY